MPVRVTVRVRVRVLVLVLVTMATRGMLQLGEEVNTIALEPRQDKPASYSELDENA